MKRLAYLFLAGTLTGACSDFNTSGNGDLDGFWQLTQTDTLANGRSEDMRPRMLFWSVQAGLLKMQDLHTQKDAYLGIFFHFELKDDRLRVYDPVVDDRTISDSIVTDVRTVEFYGLNSLDETFRVLQLEETRMTLENESLRMYFRKY